MNLEKVILEIKESEMFVEAGKKAKLRQDNLIKPKGSLGILEDISIKLAEITGNPTYRIENKEAIILVGDHGFASKRVSVYPKEVTKQMTRSYILGGAAARAIADANEVHLNVVDVGIDGKMELEGLLDRKIKNGTEDFTEGPAMTIEETKKAIEVGFEVAEKLIKEGADILIPGEMGIGGTTASSALISVFSGYSPAEVVDRGTLINDETLKRKIKVVEEAIRVNRPDKEKALEVLAKLGGFEIAAIVGVHLAAAINRRPSIVDGVIATSAALTARFIAPGCERFMFASHKSVEKGQIYALKELKLDPLFDFHMRLGEATGAIIASKIIQTASKALCDMKTFTDASVTDYEEDIRLK